MSTSALMSTPVSPVSGVSGGDEAEATALLSVSGLPLPTAHSHSSSSHKVADPESLSVSRTPGVLDVEDLHVYNMTLNNCINNVLLSNARYVQDIHLVGVVGGVDVVVGGRDFTTTVISESLVST